MIAAEPQRMTRRETLLRLLMSGGGVFVLRSAFAQILTPSPGLCQLPCDVRCYSDETLKQAAVLAIASGEWGFATQTASLAQVERSVVDALNQDLIEIDLQTQWMECSGSCTFPSFPNGAFNGITSGDAANPHSITEGLLLQILIANATCQESDPFRSPSEFWDYAVLLDGGSPSRPRFAILWPRSGVLVTSDSRQFNTTVTQPDSCMTGSPFYSAAGFATARMLWPILGGFFDDGQSIAATPFNVTANCPNGDCTDHALFTLCFGQPLATRYFESFRHRAG